MISVRAAAADVETLMGHNYAKWSWECKNALALAGLLDAVIVPPVLAGTTPTVPAGTRASVPAGTTPSVPEGTDQAEAGSSAQARPRAANPAATPALPLAAPATVDRVQDLRAHAFICLTVDATRYRSVCEANPTARGLWDALAGLHAQRALASRGVLLEQVTRLGMLPGQSVTEYWAHAEQLHAEANPAGSPPIVDTLYFALRGLQPEFDPVSNPMLTQRDAAVTFASALPALLMHEQVLQHRQSAAGGVALLAHGGPGRVGSHGRGAGGEGGEGHRRGRGRGRHNSANREGVECYNCGELGHYKSECPRPPWERGAAAGSPRRGRSVAHRPPTPAVRGSSPRRHSAHLAGSSSNTPPTMSFAAIDVAAAAAGTAATATPLRTQWLLDSGCSRHVTCNLDLLHDYQPIQPPHAIEVANGAQMTAWGEGSVRFSTAAGEVVLLRVLYVPNASANLLSMGKALRGGVVPRFRSGGCDLSPPGTAGRPFLTATLCGGLDLLVLDQQPIPAPTSHSMCMTVCAEQSAALCHQPQQPDKVAKEILVGCELGCRSYRVQGRISKNVVMDGEVELRRSSPAVVEDESEQQAAPAVAAPTNHHQAATGLLRYLKRTAAWGLVYSSSGSSQLQGYADAEYAGDPDSMRNTSGTVFVLNGAAISWRSQLQTTVAASTTEAETQAAAAATKEALFSAQGSAPPGRSSCAYNCSSLYTCNTARSCPRAVRGISADDAAENLLRQVDQHDEMLHRRALDREYAAIAKRGPGRPRKLFSIGLASCLALGCLAFSIGLTLLLLLLLPLPRKRGRPLGSKNKPKPAQQDKPRPFPHASRHGWCAILAAAPTAAALTQAVPATAAATTVAAR
ncbi:hypothetical protein QJQ45_013752, partial [Haematococcus lacustris]